MFQKRVRGTDHSLLFGTCEITSGLGHQESGQPDGVSPVWLLSKKLRELELMVCVEMLRQSLFILEQTQLQGKQGGWDLTAVFNNPTWIETDAPQESTTKGQKATWIGQAQEFAGRALPIRYTEGKVDHERS